MSPLACGEHRRFAYCGQNARTGVRFPPVVRRVHSLLKGQPPFVGIGFGIDIRCRSTGEPLGRILSATDLLQGVGVRIPKSRHRRADRLTVQVRYVEQTQRSAWLTEVAASACLHDQQFDPRSLIKASAVDTSCQLEGAFWPAKPAFAVSHDRHVVLASCHSPGRSQLGKCLLEMPRGIGGVPTGLTDDAQPVTLPSCRHRMGKSGFRVVVEKLARGDKVTCDAFGRGSAQRAELGAYRRIKFQAGDVIGYCGRGCPSRSGSCSCATTCLPFRCPFPRSA